MNAVSWPRWQVAVDAAAANLRAFTIEWNAGTFHFIPTERMIQMDQYGNPEPLHVPRETLIAKIDEEIARQKKEWDEAREKEKKANEDKLARLKAAYEQNPVALLQLVATKVEISEFKDDKSFLDYLQARFPGSKPEWKDPEPAVKLKRVLEAATNDEIEVQPSDNYYHYL